MSRDHLENMRRDFERQKCDYTIPPENRSEDEDDSENDITCQLLGVDDLVERGIFRQELRLNQKEMQELFHPTFEEIKSLVQQQVTDAELCCKRNVKAGHTLRPTNFNERELNIHRLLCLLVDLETLRI